LARFTRIGLFHDLNIACIQPAVNHGLQSRRDENLRG
jgi:hypothetical protein